VGVDTTGLATSEVATGQPGSDRDLEALERVGQIGRIAIPEVRPQLDCGRFPVKRIVGERLRVTADIVKEGHDILTAEVRYRPQGGEAWQAVPMTYGYERDEWAAEVLLERIGTLEYTVAVWTDTFASWADELRRKAQAGQEVSSELLEGGALIRAAAARAPGEIAPVLTDLADRVTGSQPQRDRVQQALQPGLARLMATHQARDDLTVYDRWLGVVVDPERARFGAWYEFFPRSQTTSPDGHGTFASAEARLPAIRALGFDVVYLPPIHPIGRTNRKGRNNSLVAEPGDPGSPWAIGNEAGGHDAVNPELGTIEDFDRFVQTARDCDLEIAMDLAIQCSPDHPYIRQHPDWFRRRPDGTIKYAENPPKKYEDIVALDMWCEDYRALWAELRRVVRHWIDHGVTIFRVDNPHTKPLAFWAWLIPQLKREHPELIFLAEAFTRPNKLQLLAKLGFTQSYTYFTWRNTRRDLEEYLTELTRTEQAEYLRPNFFANTPDILHEYLQHGGRPAFKIRFALAATLSPTYGIYSGFELIEHVPVRAGSEEYLDSEKYQIRLRDWSAPGNLNAYIARINAIRRNNRALQLYTNLTFHHADNPNIISYSKVGEDGANRILVVVNLDPYHAHAGTLHLEGAALGLGPGSRYVVHDLLTEARYWWQGTANYVGLDPHDEPVHIFRLEGV
jgi:starch synthase (maltosyl-transferring)